MRGERPAAARGRPEVEAGAPAIWFGVTGAWPVAGAVAFRLAISAASGERIGAVQLRAQVSIRANQRRYTTGEAAALDELFGPPSRWAQTLTPVPWKEVAAGEGVFRGRTERGVTLPCEMEAAAGKYLAALEGGTVPLLFLFRGWIRHRAGGRAGLAPIPRDREARFQMPLTVWRQAVGLEAMAGQKPAGVGHGL